MDYTGIFFQAFIYLLAAVITVPVAKKIGLGSVLGYLLGGVIIGPYALGLVGDNTDSVMHFAEFGVVMMLFLVGLELRPAMLWQLRRALLLTGGLQVVGTTIVIALIAKLFGTSLASAIAIGMIFTSSSTAIVLQSLNEKGWIKLEAGNVIFAILLFQDIAVIPMLAIFPLLGSGDASIDHQKLAGWEQALLIVTLIAGIIISGRYLLRPIFRFIASSRLNEAFTALALLLVIGISLAMSYVGLSPALGAFLAGVVLAESEYRHELETDIAPFKGLLLGLFFISVGTNINFPLIFEHWALVILLVLILVMTKFGVLFLLGKLLKKSLRDNLMISMMLAQGGEFCFVLISYATGQQLLSTTLSKELVAVVALSMLVTPLIILFYEKIIEPRLIAEETNDKEPDVIHQENPVIIAGFGRFGQVIGRFMIANGVGTTVLDIDPNQVEIVRKFGFKVFYGDAERLDLLNTAGLAHAKVLILAIDDTDKALKITQIVRQAYPDIRILLRVRGRTNVYDALKNDIEFKDIYRETFNSALNMAVDALNAVGISEDDARCSGIMFKEIDEMHLKKMAEIYNTKGLIGDDYISEARQITQELENVLTADRQVAHQNQDVKNVHI